MCNWIILFLLFCGGCHNGAGFLNRACGCDGGRDRDCDGGRDRDRDCGCDGGRDRDCDRGRDRDCDRGRDRDCDCDRGRDRGRDSDCGMTPPPWIRSNYANGDTCGCEEK